MKRILFIITGVLSGSFLGAFGLKAFGFLNDLMYEPYFPWQTEAVIYSILCIFIVGVFIILQYFVKKIFGFSFPTSKINNFELGFLFSLLAIYSDYCLRNVVRIPNDKYLYFEAIIFLFVLILDYLAIKFLKI